MVTYGYNWKDFDTSRPNPKTTILLVSIRRGFSHRISHPIILRRLELVSGSNWIRLDRIGSDWIRPDQTKSDGIRLDLSSGWIRLDQIKCRFILNASLDRPIYTLDRPCQIDLFPEKQQDRIDSALSRGRVTLLGLGTLACAILRISKMVFCSLFGNSFFAVVFRMLVVRVADPPLSIRSILSYR